MAERKFKPYKSYRFIERDPIIDVTVTMMTEAGLTYADVNRLSGVSTTTLYNWRRRKTKRPQFCTIAAAGAVCGKELVWVNRTKKNGK